jgi:hypothetical protein
MSKFSRLQFLSQDMRLGFKWMEAKTEVESRLGILGCQMPKMIWEETMSLTHGTILEDWGVENQAGEALDC